MSRCILASVYACYFAHGSSCKVLWWVRLCLCVYVCLPVRKDTSITTHATFTKLFLHVVCGLGLVLLQRLCDMLCTSGFVDEIMFFLIKWSQMPSVHTYIHTSIRPQKFHRNRKLTTAVTYLQFHIQVCFLADWLAKNYFFAVNFSSWPWSLTYDLHLWRWHRYGHDESPCCISASDVVSFESYSQRHTDTQATAASKPL